MGEHAQPGHTLEEVVAHVAHLLPDQGPIGVFVHHNTLHAFQHLPFHEAVQAGAQVWGARPYPETPWFQQAWREGRIEARDVDEALGAEVVPIIDGLDRRTLRRALMVDVIEGDEPGLDWHNRRGSLPVPPDLLDAAREIVARRPRTPPEGEPPRRHRDALLLLGGDDVDLDVNPEVVRLAWGFLDQGQAAVTLPGRERGFFEAVARLHAAGASAPVGCPGAREAFAAAVGRSPWEVLGAALIDLGVQGPTLEPYLTATAMALRGWAGMFARLERRPDERIEGVNPTLIDFLAVRMLYERHAIVRAAATIGAVTAWDVLRRVRAPVAPTPLADALAWVAIARAAGWSADRLRSLSDPELDALTAEIDAFPPVQRRARWLEAYEGWYRRHILDAVAARTERRIPVIGARPKAQFMFCIDEREESVRRAIEERGPQWETLGAAGFFGVAIEFQGLDDDHAAPYCPAVVTPGHEVQERHAGPDEALHQQRSTWRSIQHSLERAVLHGATETLPGGAIASVALSPALAALTALRVFAPYRSLIWAERARDWVPRPGTELTAIRTDESLGHSGKPLGFTTIEAADRVGNLLLSTGLQGRLAPIVMILGHGSTSLNNPHESAHDCGACGGRRGGANARLIAELANRPDVRATLLGRGTPIPEDTWFVGGLHDTASDAVTLYDLDRVPVASTQALEEARAVLDLARRQSAAERCRRFEHVPLPVTPDVALRHVEDRSSHLGQPRPEYGHCTNAIAFVGRRSSVRGLHFDRRAFLISFDPTLDPAGAVLERILAAVGPVGAGINLEYYFSSTDNEVYGCGTKLPHNVTGLVGVMAGHQGDLRTGLPTQMVEIHEPMRLLLIVEATPARLLEIAGRQAEVRELVVNRWVQLVSMDPDTGALSVFTGAGFDPYEPSSTLLPTVPRSEDWHGRRREHLKPSLVLAGLQEGR